MSRVERVILVQKFHKSGLDLIVERFHPIIDVFGSEFHPFSKRFLRFQPIVGRFKVEWGHFAWGEERFHPRGHFKRDHFAWGEERFHPRGHFAWGEERFHPIIGHLGSQFRSIVEDFGDYQDLGSLDGVSDFRGGSELLGCHFCIANVLGMSSQTGSDSATKLGSVHLFSVTADIMAVSALATLQPMSRFSRCVGEVLV